MGRDHDVTPGLETQMDRGDPTSPNIVGEIWLMATCDVEKEEGRGSTCEAEWWGSNASRGGAHPTVAERTRGHMNWRSMIRPRVWCSLNYRAGNEITVDCEAYKITISIQYQRELRKEPLDASYTPT
ncbi:uncharacterized protein G2W53_019313 [Senna tora]|uniref:Uncharacterized protein n=1 Tax=Senna tora TaxID=362788 RepID=A0A834U1V0_9FABA|nr:uncharacterized protein G2W53_019313 [Senna tora]